MNWIKVVDQMPPLDTNVLCWVIKKRLIGDETKEFHVGRWNGRFWLIGNFFSWDIGEPTHWQPLPEPPKE